MIALRRTSALVAAAGVFVALAVVSAATRKAAVATVSPIRPPDGWRPLYVGAVVAAFVAYVAAIALVSRRPARLGAVIAAAVAIQLAPLAAPLLLSTDAYSYWDYGRIAAVHGGNPYADRPSRWPDDPAYRRMGEDWRERTSVYGPSFTLASEAGSRAAPGPGFFRVLAAAAMVALVLIVARTSAFAAAFVGWNPLLALHFAGGGHNDALMMVPVAGALAFAAVGRHRAEGALWAAALSVKLIALVFLPLRAAEAYRRGRPVARLAAGFALAAAAVAAATSFRYGTAWLAVLSPLTNQLRRSSSLGLPYWLAKAGVPQAPARDALLLLFALVYLWLLREAWRGRARLGVCAAALVLATPWLQPWYAVWVVPLAAVEDDRLARLAALALTGYLLRDAIPL